MPPMSDVVEPVTEEPADRGDRDSADLMGEQIDQSSLNWLVVDLDLILGRSVPVEREGSC